MNRRSFLTTTLTSALVGVASSATRADEEKKVIQGFDETDTVIDESQVWRPVSDKKIRVGIAGFGACQFGAAFGFQNHPNVEVVAVTDLFPDRCAGLAKACRCEKTYESLEAMVTDPNIDAVFLATDAPHHADHAVLALNCGKHVASCVPAYWGGTPEQAEKLFETVKTTGLKYGMFETSAYHDDVFAARKIYQAGGFGDAKL